MIEATLCYLVSAGRLLLLERVKPPGKSYWNAPGGKLVQGESPEECVKREVLEETGLVLLKQKRRGQLVYKSSEAGAQIEDWFIRVFYATDGDFGGKLVVSDEHRTARWFPLGEIPWDNMWPDDKHFLPIVIEMDKNFKAESRYVDGKLVDFTLKVDY
ncbi:8-oxo-dGTP diphosphatase [archaeon]|nr:8-oxo-dGTP diphosphatase [archaeon]